jgi:hypothetical protein
MSLNAENQLAIVRHLAEKAGNVAECGYILPAPIYFSGVEDFQAQIASLTLETQKEIERTPVAFTVISYLRFEDLPDGAEEGTQIQVFYNFYIFRRRAYERMDQTATPDDFLKKVLKSYNDFVAAIVNLREEFRGNQPIPALGEAEGFAEAETAGLTQDDIISDGSEACRYIPGVRGFAAELQGVVNLTLIEC